MYDALAAQSGGGGNAADDVPTFDEGGGNCGADTGTGGNGCALPKDCGLGNAGGGGGSALPNTAALDVGGGGSALPNVAALDVAAAIAFSAACSCTTYAGGGTVGGFGTFGATAGTEILT